MLRTTTNITEVDVLLLALVRRFAEAFPERVHAVFVLGGHADGTAGPLSDLDYAVVFKHAFENEAEFEQGFLESRFNVAS